MSDRIEKAIAAATQTRALIIGEGCLSKIGEVFKKQFEGKSARIVADGNTWKAAGELAEKYLASSNVKTDKAYIFQESELHAEYGYVERLCDIFKESDSIPISVGGGTINDIVKLAAYNVGREYMCVATAASVDGYTSYGSSMIRNGSKKSISCAAPAVVLADPSVIRTAPPELTASGYADLSAKTVSSADWVLADFLGVEAIDSTAWNIVKDGLDEALSDPIGVRDGNSEALDRLSEGLMMSGFAMQWLKSSRPASGAEHQFSHLWDMEHHTHNGVEPSHGFKVGIGTLSMTALYEEAFKEDFSNLDIDECLANWGTLEDRLKYTEELLKGTDIIDFAKKEVSAKYVDGETLRKRLEFVKNNWGKLKEKLGEQILPYSDLRKRLQIVGAPVDCEEIGVSREKLRRSFFRAQCIRDRYTMLDFAFQTNKLSKWVDALFSEGGTLHR